MMESGDYINRFTRILNEYCATLTKLSAEGGTVDSVSSIGTATTVQMSRSSPVIDCGIVFHDFANYKVFINDLDDIHRSKRNRTELHMQYPHLREAYDEYIMLEKLYGG